MPRGIAWDELPTPHLRYRPDHAQARKERLRKRAIDEEEGNDPNTENVSSDANVLSTRDFKDDAIDISKRLLFGGITGFITGAVFTTGEMLTALPVCNIVYYSFL